MLDIFADAVGVSKNMTSSSPSKYIRILNHQRDPEGCAGIGKNCRAWCKKKILT